MANYKGSKTKNKVMGMYFQCLWACFGDRKRRFPENANL